MSYMVKKIDSPARLDAEWSSPAWAAAETLTVGNFRPEGSDHRPLVQCRLLHDAVGIYGMFQVHVVRLGLLLGLLQRAKQLR